MSPLSLARSTTRPVANVIHGHGTEAALSNDITREPLLIALSIRRITQVHFPSEEALKEIEKAITLIVSAHYQPLPVNKSNPNPMAALTGILSSVHRLLVDAASQKSIFSRPSRSTIASQLYQSFQALSEAYARAKDIPLDEARAKVVSLPNKESTQQKMLIPSEGQVIVKRVPKRQDSQIYTSTGITSTWRTSFWKNTHHGTVNGQAVVIKSYNEDQEKLFLKDIEVIRGNWSQHLPQIVSTSPGEDGRRMLAMIPVNAMPIAQFISSVSSTAPTEALTATLKMLQNAQSAGVFLASRDAHIDYHIFMDAVIEESGRVVLNPRNITHQSQSTVIKPGNPHVQHALDYALSVALKTHTARRVTRPLWLALGQGQPLLRYLVDQVPARSTRSFLMEGKATDPIMKVAYTPGDVGRFYVRYDGSRLFQVVANLASGITMEVKSMVYGTPAAPRVWWKKTSRQGGKFSGKIKLTVGMPHQQAYDALQSNAIALGKKHDVRPEELVIITNGVMDVTSTFESDLPGPFYLMAHVDVYGRVTNAYWSTHASPVNDPPHLDGISKAPINVQWITSRHIRMIQLEPEDLGLKFCEVSR